MNTQTTDPIADLIATFKEERALNAFDGPVPIRYSTLPPLTDDYWERRAHHAEEKLQEAHDAIRCACDWLQLQAPGRALEVLEANLK